MMEWTRAQRYLPYEKHSALELLKLQAQADNSPEQLRYHIRPTSGLLNDPNGFSYFNHAWHVFYQAFPFGATHGLKSWMHMESADLVHWRNHGLALAPGKQYDSHGAYSGSAKPIGHRLFLMYTGNHRDADWHRTPYQLGAWMDTDNQVTKLDHPLFKNPSYVSEHFRDPQILTHDGHYYALIGAQDAKTKEGHLALWTSDHLTDGWRDLGYVKFTSHPMGYMIECPNLVQVDGQPVIIFCPQGLSKQITQYQNIYPDMYITGDHFDYDAAQLVGSSEVPRNLDEGFDVYASQAFNAPDGSAYLISWVGLPDLSYPTDQQNWANCLSQVKKLHLKDGHLYQQPVDAMASLRDPQKTTVFSNQTTVINPAAGQQYELKLTIAKGQHGNLHLAANQQLTTGLQIKFDTEKGLLTVDRSHCDQAVNVKYGTTRSVKLPAHQDLQLQIFLDHSLAEIFVNKGRHLLTLRYFTNQSDGQVAFDSPINATGTLYHLLNK